MVAFPSAILAVPLLLTVTVWATEVLLTAIVPKDSVEGVAMTVGVPCPVPESKTTCVAVCRVSGSET